MKSVKLFLLVGPLLVGLFSGCQTHSVDLASDNLEAQVSDFPNNVILTGHIAQPIRHGQQQYWLLTSEQQGVLLTDSKGQVLSQFKGNTEMLDIRNDIQVGDKNYTLIATLDNNQEQVVILGLDWQTQQLSLLKRLPKAQAQTEALCWYAMPSGHLSLFVADTLGHVEQRIVVNGNSHQLTEDTVINRFVGAPQMKSCAVDDASRSLYLVEENIGVWHYSADHESELERELIAASQPFGGLKGEITHLEVLANGDLLISTPEQQGAWWVDRQQGRSAKFLALKGSSTPETVSAIQDGEQLLLGIFDKDAERYQLATLALPLIPRVLTAEPFSQVSAYAETQPMQAYGDAADDPAIWINFNQPEQSRVLGTNKKQGLMLYDLAGQLIQEFDVGRVNNVDLRYEFKLAGKSIDIVAASNRSTNSVSLFSIDPLNGDMAYLTEFATDIKDVYGLCMYRNNQQYYVFVNGTDGRFQQYLLSTKGASITGQLVREFQVPSQPEGCVADDQNQQLYFGEEAAGVWQVSAEPSTGSQAAKLIIGTNARFVADVEGMGLYQYSGQRFLFASSQGNNSYGVFALDNDNQYLGSFQIDLDLHSLVDGVSETDGLAITAYPLGASLPSGLLVVQDGRNRLPQAPQNFKLVDGRHLHHLLDQWLLDIN